MFDALAIVLLLAAGAAFLAGEAALAAAEDARALYLLVVGVTCLRAAVQVARPGEAAR